MRDSFIWKDLEEVRNIRQVFGRGFWMGSALAGMMTVTKGKLPPGPFRTERDSEHDLVRSGRAATYAKPDGTLTFDKPSSVFLSGNRTRDDAPDHLRVQHHVPRDLAELWESMCPAQVYALGRDVGNGEVEVEVTPSNCVQCGAITAKGGRLTPPEGGSGPEYTVT